MPPFRLLAQCQYLPSKALLARSKNSEYRIENCESLQAPSLLLYHCITIISTMISISTFWWMAGEDFSSGAISRSLCRQQVVCFQLINCTAAMSHRLSLWKWIMENSIKFFNFADTLEIVGWYLLINFSSPTKNQKINQLKFHFQVFFFSRFFFSRYSYYSYSSCYFLLLLLCFTVLLSRMEMYGNDI